MGGIQGQRWGIERGTSVLIAVPTFENISPETFRSISRNLKNSRMENLDFDFVKGYDCARARNKIVEKALEGEYDYVLMVDSDIILPDNAINLFSDWKFDVIFGYSPRKDDPSMTEIYRHNSRWAKEDRFTMDELTNSEVDMLLCDGGSFGCAWISTSVLDRLDKPYFDYVNYPNGEVFSEDLYFCRALKEKKIASYVHTKVRCKHIAKKIVE